MREIALDATCIQNAWAYARDHPEFWLRCYEAGFGKPPQAIGLTVEDKRESYTVDLGGFSAASLEDTRTSTLSDSDLN